ncbi:MAG TPA: hypothetical protein VGB00_00250 [Pyrinomonadaceae bacterium]|jgi:hypothetical protein
MTAKEHNKLIGIFLMAHGGLQLLIMGFIGVVYGVLGSAMLATARRDEEAMVGGIFIVVVLFLLVFSLLLIVPQIWGGYRMLKEKPGARTWGIIGSILSCLSFPLGTAAGVYGLWFLFGDEGKRFYLGGAPQQPMFNAPPPPNNWR